MHLTIIAAADAIKPIGNPIPCCLFLVLIFLPPLNTKYLFYWLFPPCHSNKSSSSWLIVYVQCLNVSPVLDNIYRYSAIEYVQTLTLSFFDAATLRNWIIYVVCWGSYTRSIPAPSHRLLIQKILCVKLSTSIFFSLVKL